MNTLYFSGFGFSGEFELFSHRLPKSLDYAVVGFSMGAIDAFEYVLNSKTRVEELILISPAFYQHTDITFKKTQLLNFKKNSQKYQAGVYNACESKTDLTSYKTTASYSQLDRLLNYSFLEENIKNTIERGTKITVYLGGKDRVIESFAALEFFEQFATVYFFKKANHLMEEL